MAGCTVTIPDNADVAFEINTEMHFRQCAVAPVFIESSTSVIINGISGFANNTDIEGAVITVKKVGTDEWDVFGRLEAVTST